jgi:hypothetical protein
MRSSLLSAYEEHKRATNHGLTLYPGNAVGQLQYFVLIVEEAAAGDAAELLELVAVVTKRGVKDSINKTAPSRCMPLLCLLITIMPV